MCRSAVGVAEYIKLPGGLAVNARERNWTKDDRLVCPNWKVALVVLVELMLTGDEGIVAKLEYSNLLALFILHGLMGCREE